MKLGKAAAVGVTTLALGFALGNFGTALAVTDTTSSAATTVATCGLRIGQSMRDAGGRLADVVASLTGMKVEDVQAKRAAGQSIADIAKAEGIDSDKVVAKALALRSEALEAKVKAGEITQAQADEAKKRMTERLTERVSSTETGRGNGQSQGKRDGSGQGERKQDGSGQGERKQDGSGGGQGRGMGGGQGANGDGTCTQTQ